MISKNDLNWIGNIILIFTVVHKKYLYMYIRDDIVVQLVIFQF